MTISSGEEQLIPNHKFLCIKQRRVDGFFVLIEFSDFFCYTLFTVNQRGKYLDYEICTLLLCIFCYHCVATCTRMIFCNEYKSDITCYNILCCCHIAFWGFPLPFSMVWTCGAYAVFLYVVNPVGPDNPPTCLIIYSK